MIESSPLPAPLVPAEVDLRDFPYMQLDVQRLRDCRFALVSSGDGFRAAVLLWCAAWHQVPAASLPDDDVELAHLAGFGRFVQEFRKVKDEALYGFVRCADGRWHHPVIAEKALDAWASKEQHAYERMVDRARKANKQRKENSLPPFLIPAFDEWKADGKRDPYRVEMPISDDPPKPSGGPAEDSEGIPEEPERPSAGIPAENPLKGEGEGEGKGKGKGKGKKEEIPPPDARESAPNDGMPPCIPRDEWEAYRAERELGGRPMSIGQITACWRELASMELNGYDAGKALRRATAGGGLRTFDHRPETRKEGVAPVRASPGGDSAGAPRYQRGNAAAVAEAKARFRQKHGAGTAADVIDGECSHAVG